MKWLTNLLTQNKPTKRKSGKSVNLPKYLLTRLFSMLTFQTDSLLDEKEEKYSFPWVKIIILNTNIISRLAYMNYNIKGMEN